MKLIATPERMRVLDNTAIRRYGIPGIILMENAGRSFVSELDNDRTDWTDSEVVVVCGRGNNGGDGFVIARHLANRGAGVVVYLCGKKSQVRGDARKNLSILLAMAKDRGSRIRLTEVRSLRSLKKEAGIDLVIDALLGIGFAGTLSGLELKLVQWMNRTGAPVYSVDVPSGLNASDGLVASEAVRATVTVTMGLPKIGLLVGDGPDHAGEVRVVDIGIPETAIRPGRDELFVAETADVRSVLPPRPHRAHKHSVGKVLVIAGSRNYTGAPYMCAQSALRSGAGTVMLVVPSSIHLLLAKKLTEAMVLGVPETDEGTLSIDAFDTIEERIGWADVVVAGPGLSRHADTMFLLRRLLKKIPRPLVLDADGLAPLRDQPALVRQRKSPTVLTPHTGELGYMINRDAAEIESCRIAAAREAAAAFRSTLLLKGSPTVTALREGGVILNSTGNAGMATAGSGDVLAGVIAGLIGQGVPAGKAAWAGALIHGLSGDLARKRFGERGLMALDICDQIPHALNLIESKQGNLI
ncbi:MAG: NAD(P)H-hydrate dehydratase [Ignavibacteria bacterium]|nr:NAD(P)H-hydrate dehydratase [Ignavibacteria bacterium]